MLFPSAHAQKRVLYRLGTISSLSISACGNIFMRVAMHVPKNKLSRQFTKVIFLFHIQWEIDHSYTNDSKLETIWRSFCYQNTICLNSEREGAKLDGENV